ncbi:MAG: hypothetical protein ACOCVR_02365, partial [Myxococcota bacterium]
LVWATTRIVLPEPTGENMAPLGLRTLTSWLLSGFVEKDVRVSLMSLGSLALLFIPAEVVSPLAAEWEREVERITGIERVRVVSLADGYAGYLETPSALEARTGESANCWYGTEAVERLGDGVRELAAWMVARQAGMTEGRRQER